MKFLSNMRISHKISALMAGLVLGFITIGVTYYVQINIDQSLRKQEQETLSFQNTLSEINLLNVQMNAVTNQVIFSGDSNAVENHNTLWSELESLLAAVRGEAIKLNIGKNIGEIISLHTQHQTLFDQAFTEFSSFGFTSAEGVRGQLTIATNELESTLQRNQAGEQLALLNTIDSAINIYLSTRNETFLAQIDAQQTQLHDMLSNSNLAPQTKRVALDQQLEIARIFSVADESVKNLALLSQSLSEQQKNTSAAFANVQKTVADVSASILADASEKSRFIQVAVVAIIFVVAMGTAVGVYLIYKSIIFPMAHMQNVIRRINRGKTNARVKLISNDELGDLGKAFNQLFNERIQQLQDSSLENEKLNNSIISLIRALGMIAQKDLTIKVPVSPDITGTISDAVNLLTSETAKTLHEVRDISMEVNDVSEKLQDQSVVVGQFAENERRQILATSKALEVLARAMNTIAKSSENANASAGQAIEHTQSARQAVQQTVAGIRTIRETISETEKRMKRLGDRSQEISGIVNLINTIAERTHILALNASMHAASAGEAGKGFAVVADEVQRLAESARESTDEISSMVNNIRVETADTVTIMNTLISQVADGSKLAEKAGQQMTETETATQQLVETVQTIAEQAVEQALVANRVRDRATIIRNFTEKTGKQLAQQQAYTESLKNCADTLVERVGVFKLPESNTPAEETPKLHSVS